MAVGLRGIVAAARSTTGTDVTTGTLTIPAGVQTGDIAYYAVQQAGAQAITAITATGSWSLTPIAVDTFNSNNRLSIFERTLTTAEAGTTISATFAAAQQWVHALIVLSGGSARDGLGADAGNGTGGTSIALGTVTPVANDDAIIYITAIRPSTTGLTPNLPTATSYTEDTDTAIPAGTASRCGIVIGHRFLTGGAGAAQNIGSVTASTNLGSWVSFPIAVAPSGPSPQTMSPTGLDDGGSVPGSPTVRLQLAATGIGTGEAFGTATVKLSVQATGIPSAEAFGTPSVALSLSPGGITSGEAFGSPTVSLGAGATTLSPTGIPSGEQFGTTTATLRMQPAGIGTAEAFGAPTVGLRVQPTGIGTAEVFGAVTLSMVGPTTLIPTGIASAQAFGAPTVSMAGPTTISPAGIGTGEALGAPTVTLLLGVLTLAPTGIGSAEAFGLPVVSLGTFVFVGPSTTDLHRFRPHQELEHPDLANERLIHQPPLMVEHVIGLTVWRDPGGTWHTAMYTTWEQQQTADRFYAGGHRHPVGPAEAAELIEAGYGAYLRPT